MSNVIINSAQFCDVQELRFETAKCSYMGCDTLLEGWFFDAPKSSFQGAKIRIWAVIISIIYFSEIVFSGAKHWNRSSTILQDIRFADVQESRFQGENLTNMDSALQQLRWFADSKESRFYVAKRWYIDIASPQGVRFLMLRIPVFRLRKFQVCVFTSCVRFN